MVGLQCGVSAVVIAGVQPAGEGDAVAAHAQQFVPGDGVAPAGGPDQPADGLPPATSYRPAHATPHRQKRNTGPRPRVLTCRAARPGVRW
ncbi:hypothetical protein TPA0906_37230 [Streptomyces olivaceus]|nr:hypothetical protein TPA0906_37230 [Streptomyces olivaceus]